MQLLKIGGTFENGTIVAITRSGVTTRASDGALRCYSPAEVEAAMQRQLAEQPRHKTVTCARRAKRARQKQTAS